MKKILLLIMLFLFVFVDYVVADASFSAKNSNLQSYESSSEMLVEDLDVELYDAQLDGGYNPRNALSQTLYGTKSLVDIKLEYNSSENLTTGRNEICAEYGLDISEATLYLRLNYNSSLNTNDIMLISDDWGNSESQTVAGVKVGNVGTGAVVIKTSFDGVNWHGLDASRYSSEKYMTDFYNVYKADVDVPVFSPTKDEIDKGIYIKTFYVYELGKKVPCTHKDFWGNPKDEYDLEYYNYVETSTIFLYNKAQKIEKVSELLDVKLYDAGLDSGYNEKKELNGTPYLTESLTEIKLYHNKSDNILINADENIVKYGLSEAGATINLRFKYNSTLNTSNVMLISDDWGGTDGQLVNGVRTGQVGTGAVIVKTSYDGINWQNLEDGKYADGLYTTDFYKAYGADIDVPIYTPSGEDINKGVYIKIVFAYELGKKTPCTHKDFWGNPKDEYDLEYYNYVETSTFFLCNRVINAVTIHNLTLNDNLTEENLGTDSITASIYQKAETMTHNSMTTTGFSIDNSLNKQITIKVYHNSSQVYTELNNTFTEDGRYDVYLENHFGEIDKKVIYIDKKDVTESFEQYFGGKFLDGKRIYSEGNIPVYEGGLTSYNILGLTDDVMPLSGYITNMTTGEIVKIDATHDAKTKVLSSPGVYKVELKTSFNDEVVSGDVKKFTFNFQIIAEGTAPGPTINEANLKEYMKTNVSDYASCYYGVTYSSAAKGYITLCFSTYKAAYDFSYNYAKGTVEPQEDGSYRYDGSFIVGQKVVYDSAWDLTDAVHYFASSAVQKLYFDMSDVFTYTTLDEEVLDNTLNLRTLELSASIVLVANEEERNKLTNVNEYPIISKKPYSYLEVGLDGKRVTGYYDFEFIKDVNGYDSYKVTIVDCNGVEYIIDYNKGVGEQLESLGCASGIVTIIEETVYGDKNEYKAIFISEGTNTTEIEVSYIYNDETKQAVVNSSNYSVSFVANIFSLIDAVDDLDPYSIVKIVSPSKSIVYYTIDEIAEIKLHEVGEYTITCINRLGFTFDFNVVIEEGADVYVTINGTDNTIITHFGATNVSLPTLTKYGYIHAGYMDENGNRYNSEIAEILFKGNMILNPIWEAKKYTITYITPNGKVDQTVEFGGEYTLVTPDISEEYEFLGWTLNDQLYDSKTITVSEEGDIKLFSLTKKVKSRIKLDDGTNVFEKLHIIGETIYLNSPYKEGYEFLGWYVNDKIVEGNSYVVTDEGVTIVAKWKKLDNQNTGETNPNEPEKDPETNVPDTTEPEEEGCSGSAVASIFGVLTLFGTVVILRKKRKHNEID